MKSTKHIIVPEEWKGVDDFSSHRELLYLALKNTTGTVCELGCGDGSTHLLYDYCMRHHRKFWSFDTNKEWAERFWYVTNYVQDYLKDVNVMCEVLFVDCAPALLRKELIERYANEAKVIIVHDSEKSSSFCYDLEPILSTFKYRVNYEPAGMPHTTLVSNTVNVEEWI